MTQATRHHHRETLTTARRAFLAGLPGLGLTALAAAGSTSLAIRADLVLTILDMVAMGGVWRLATRDGQVADQTGSSRHETRVTALVTLCMILSMIAVAGEALARLMAGASTPEGPGLWIGLLLNAGSGIVNLLILSRWRARHRCAPSALTRSQICLFSDKLCSNVLLTVALALTLTLQGHPAAPAIDPVTSLLMVTASARWCWPVLQELCRQWWGSSVRLDRAPSTKDAAL